MQLIPLLDGAHAALCISLDRKCKKIEMVFFKERDKTTYILKSKKEMQENVSIYLL